MTTLTGPASSERKLPAAGGRPPSPDTMGEGTWEEFARFPSTEEFCREWLCVEGQRFAGVSRAAVFTFDARQASPALIAAWPDAGEVDQLASVAAQAATRKRGVGILPPTGAATGWRLAHPVTVAREVRAAVAFEFSVAPEGGLPAALGRLQSAVGGLEAFFGRDAQAAGTPPASARLRGVVEVVASALGSERFLPCAQSFVGTLANRLGCDRVSIGFVERGQVRVRAVSHTADVRKRAAVVRAVASAMEEALDQKTSVVQPAPPGVVQVGLAHEALARTGPSAVCTVPFAQGSRLVGAVTLERPAERPFDPATVDFVDAAAALAGPALNALRREDRWLPAKVADSLQGLVGGLLGARHMGLKLAALAAAGAAAFLALAEGEHRLTARAVMEPKIRRAAVAPVRGYLREAQVRAGDRVSRGQVLAVLDDRELRLERAKWESQRAQLVRQRSVALAQLSAAQVGIAAAQIAQADANVALIDDQLAKMRLQAEFDGVVVSGDLSQSLGSPIEKGQVLFEIAPLDSYRLVLQVDERDVGSIVPGQAGQVVLAAAPADTMGFVVKQITPVSTAHEGRNYFRVEATPDASPAGLRPGLEGVAKIPTGSGRLVSVWVRPIVDWLRLAAWTWLP